MRQVQQDCKNDAAALDRTTFTPRGVGEALGTTLAMVAAVARAAELLAEELETERKQRKEADATLDSMLWNATS
jgi:hypothetical protein